MPNSFMDRLQTFDKPDGFNPYSLGHKRYGIMGAPQQGSLSGSSESMRGYGLRDMETKARKKAVLDRMQAMNAGAYGAPAALRSY